MTDDPQAPTEQGFEAASAHLTASLEPRRGSPLGKAVRAVAGIVIGMVSGDGDSGPSTIDLVVTRRENGNEVLRVSAGPIVEADRLLQTVHRDLATKSVTEFLAEWRHLDDDPS